MSPVNRRDLEAAIRAAWALDTCDPVDADDWSQANPSRGQCGSTALVIHDLLGGELLIAQVLRTDGSRQGVHYWNLLPDGTEVDLTREQFAGHEVVQQPRVVARPGGLPKRGAQQYLTMKDRVLTALGLSPLPVTQRPALRLPGRLGHQQPVARRDDRVVGQPEVELPVPDQPEHQPQALAPDRA
jgi:hypothetical protein